MAEQNSGGQADQESKKAKDTAGEVAKGASKAGKAAAGALKGFAQGGVAGAAVNVLKSGGGKYCVIGGCVGCMLPIILFVCLIWFIGSLLTGIFFGTATVQTPETDPGTLYSMYADKIGTTLSEMYAEDIYDINDFVKAYPDSEEKTEVIDGVKHTRVTNTIVGEVTINDDNIVEGTEEETGNGATYDIDLTDEVCFVISAYSVTQPYGASTTDNADDISDIIDRNLKKVNLFPMDDPIETMGIEQLVGRETRYKQATDDLGAPITHDNGTPVLELDEDGFPIVDEIVETYNVPYNLEFTIEEFNEEAVYEMFDIDPEGKYIDLIEQTTGDDTQGGIIVYTFNNFMELTVESALEGRYESKNKNTESDDFEPIEMTEEQTIEWLNQITGPFMYVGLNYDMQTTDDGKTTYPDDEDNNWINYMITVFNNSNGKAIAVIEDTIDTDALEVISMDGSAGNQGGGTGSETGGSFAPVVQSNPKYDEETGKVTWTFDMEDHVASFVELMCQSQEGAYYEAQIDNMATISLYEAVVDENNATITDEDGNYLLGDLIWKQNTNKTQISTQVIDGKSKDGLVSNREHVEEQEQSMIDELRNENQPTENMEDQVYTVVINGASDVSVGSYGSGTLMSISGYIWPLDDYGTDSISSDFGWRWIDKDGDGVKEKDWHQGIDIAAAANTPILCAKDGTVKEVGCDNARGYYIVIKHDDTHYTLYQHMIAASSLQKGDSVNQRQVVGYVGKTGTATGYHLHYEFLDSSLGDKYYHNELEGQESRPLCVDPMILYTSSSATDGAVSLGNNYNTILNMLLSTAQGFVDESPYVKAGHGNTIGTADPSTSKSHLIDYFEKHSNLFTDSDKDGFERIVNQSTDITSLWEVLNSSLGNKGYALGESTKTAMPYVFDCSGLTGYIYSTVNIDITLYIGNDHDGQLSRGEYVRNGSGTQISNNTMSSKDYSWSSISGYVKPGDLIYTRSGKSGEATHVIFYLGDGQYVSAPDTGLLVKEGNVESDYWNQGRVVAIKRFIKE